MRNKGMVISVLVVLILLVAGATVITNNHNKNKNSNSMGNMPMNNSASSQGSSSNKAATPVAATDVKISNFAFTPASITVKAGQTVTWTNEDSVEHTVTADTVSGDAPASQTLANGAKYSFTFTKAGTYSYHCQIHPNMKGTVTVTQ